MLGKEEYLTMKTTLTLAAALGLLFMMAACSHAPADNRDADTKVIRDLETAWNNDIKTKDPAKWAGYYAEDAVLMVPGMKPVLGKTAIAEALKQFTADPNLSLSFSANHVEVARSGDLAVTQGTYTMTMTDPVSKNKMTDTGTYETTFKKQADGSWKAVFDANVSDVPPQAPAVKQKK